MGWYGAYKLIKEESWEALREFLKGEIDPDRTIYEASMHIAGKTGAPTPKRIEAIYRRIKRKMWGKRRKADEPKKV